MGGATGHFESPQSEPPRQVVVLKLSALGDVCQTLPVIRTLQRAWPATHFTWIIGRGEAMLFEGITDIDFLILNKRAGWSGYAQLHRALRGRHFDLLLHMQFALRASVAAALVRAPVKVGFDRERALDLQWLFTNERIAPGANEHVSDALFGFARHCGVHERDWRWDIPTTEAARARAERLIPEGTRALIVSPCSSHPLRNWRAERYARVADYAAIHLGMRVLLCGGRSALEQKTAAQVARSMQQPCVNLVGTDTIGELYALLKRATLLVTPDSGPAHLATAAGLPVIGLYAATRSARSGPYFSRQWCVDRFDLAARTYLKRDAAELPWRTKIEQPGVMDLIQPEDVIERLVAWGASA